MPESAKKVWRERTQFATLVAMLFVLVAVFAGGVLFTVFVVCAAVAAIVALYALRRLRNEIEAELEE